MNLPLNPRTEEIALKIPKKFRNIILNSIIARSLENDIFIKEVSLYLSSEELETILEDLNIKYTVKKETKRARSQRTKEKNEIKKQEFKEQEELDFFVGFDE